MVVSAGLYYALRPVFAQEAEREPAAA
jgi:hypothetical protein